MLKNLKSDAEGNVSMEAWNKFMKDISKTRSESVLEGFLSFCEGIIESKITLSESHTHCLISQEYFK